MKDVIIYERKESRLEAFPAENYVDYMTNVMPIPETHLFYLPGRRKAIICEVWVDEKGVKSLAWRVEEYGEVPNTSQISVDACKIDEILAILTEAVTPHPCGICTKVLGKYLEFF